MSIIKKGSRIDMHCHVLGDGKSLEDALKAKDIYYNVDDNSNDLSKFVIKNVVSKLIEANINDNGGQINHGDISADNYLQLIYSLLKSSIELDGIVLLAMDAYYEYGANLPNEKLTDLYINNEYLYDKINSLNARFREEKIDKQFYLGASVSPNRKDWEKELDNACDNYKAVLIKWIPSAMNIEVDNRINIPFYKKLAAKNIPLLCHVGFELAFISGMNCYKKDHYEHLRLPLECGVKVIAAHCAAPIIMTNKKPVIDFLNFMKEFNKNGDIKLWADTSALNMSTRALLVEKYAKTYPPEWLIQGSDFPVPIDAIAHIPNFFNDIKPSEFYNFSRIKNPLDMDIAIKRAHGFDDSIITNFSNLFD